MIQMGGHTGLRINTNNVIFSKLKEKKLKRATTYRIVMWETRKQNFFVLIGMKITLNHKFFTIFRCFEIFLFLNQHVNSNLIFESSHCSSK